MPVNDWAIGALYQPGGIGGFWIQPDGVGGLVYPQQVRANSNLLTTEPFTELTGVYMFGCGHSANECMVFRDYDYETGMSVALLCCPLCSFVQRTIEPFEDAVYGNTANLLNSTLYP
jgi:hypothetical protein